MITNSSAVNGIQTVQAKTYNSKTGNYDTIVVHDSQLTELQDTETPFEFLDEIFEVFQKIGILPDEWKKLRNEAVEKEAALTKETDKNVGATLSASQTISDTDKEETIEGDLYPVPENKTTEETDGIKDPA